MIPMLDLKAEYEYMKADVDLAIQRCLEHQHWILGPEVGELEGAIAGYLGSAHCVGTSSGTEALVIALRALALKTKGQEFFDTDDEIITTPFTFTATGDAILRAGATPVFADISPDTFNLSPQRLKEAVGPKTVGIVAVHLYGQSCDMDAIGQIARDRGLFIVEDVAQAFGADYKGSRLGTIGAVGAFSFFPSKNLGGYGDGGMVCTDDAALEGLIRMLIKHGGKDKYNVNHVGYNARLDTIQAAVLLAKMKHINTFTEKRLALASVYTEGLKGIADLILPRRDSRAKHVFHQYTVRTARRDELQKFLNSKGVSSLVYYPVCLHRMKLFENRCHISGGLDNAEKASSEVLSLPMGPLQSAQATQKIIKSVKMFFGV